MSGELIYDVGTAPAGTYGFEPVFAEHNDAHCVVETEMLFLGEGAVTYFTPEGEVDYVFNAMTLKAAQDGAATTGYRWRGLKASPSQINCSRVQRPLL